MVVKEEQERVRALLADTITLLCRNGLTYKSEFNISAVIGITLDKEDVMLVDIRETIKNTVDDDVAAEESVPESEEETPTKRSRKRRKYRKASENSNEEICLSDKQFEQVHLKTEHSVDDDTDDIVFIKDEPRDSLDSSSMDLSQLSQSQFPSQQASPFASQYTMQGTASSIAGTVNMSWDQSQQLPQQNQQQQVAAFSTPVSSAVPSNQGFSTPPMCVDGLGHFWRKRTSRRGICYRHKGPVTSDLYGCSVCQASECAECRAAGESTDDPAAAAAAAGGGGGCRKYKYDSTRRKRTFQEQWRSEYWWLQYHDERMYCVVCKACHGDDDIKDGGPFITGCNTFRKDSLKAHEKSASHGGNVMRWNEFIAMQPGGKHPESDAAKVQAEGDMAKVQAEEEVDKAKVQAVEEGDLGHEASSQQPQVPLVSLSVVEELRLESGADHESRDSKDSVMSAGGASLRDLLD